MSGLVHDHSQYPHPRWGEGDQIGAGSTPPKSSPIGGSTSPASSTHRPELTDNPKSGRAILRPWAARRLEFALPPASAYPMPV